MSKLIACSGADCSSEVETRNWRRSKKRIGGGLTVCNGRSKKEITVEYNPEQKYVLVKPVFFNSNFNDNVMFTIFLVYDRYLGQKLSYLLVHCRYTKNEPSVAELEPNFNIWAEVYV